MIKTPCEIMIWGFLPAVRRELVIAMVKKGLERKEIAKVFSITEPAISQYMKSKRGAGFKLDNEIKKEIMSSADRIVKSKKRETAIKEICRLCTLARKKRLLCKAHKKENPFLKSCSLYKKICYGG